MSVQVSIDSGVGVIGEFKPSGIQIGVGSSIFLATDLAGKVTHFDLEEMRKHAENGCPFAKSFKGFYERIKKESIDYDVLHKICARYFDDSTGYAGEIASEIHAALTKSKGGE